MNSKAIILSYFILLFSTSVFAQTLTLNDLNSIYQNDIEFANDLLSKKGFEFYLSEDNENSDFKTTWTLNRSNYNNRAQKFIIKSCQKKSCGIVWYQIPSVTEFNNMKSFAKTSGYKLINSYRDELGYLNFEYTNNFYRVEFSQGLAKSTPQNSYTITFGKNRSKN